MNNSGIVRRLARVYSKDAGRDAQEVFLWETSREVKRGIYEVTRMGIVGASSHKDAFDRVKSVIFREHGSSGTSHMLSIFELELRTGGNDWAVLIRNKEREVVTWISPLGARSYGRAPGLRYSSEIDRMDSDPILNSTFAQGGYKVFAFEAAGVWWPPIDRDRNRGLVIARNLDDALDRTTEFYTSQPLAFGTDTIHISGLALPGENLVVARGRVEARWLSETAAACEKVPESSRRDIMLVGSERRAEINGKPVAQSGPLREIIRKSHGSVDALSHT